MIKYEDIVNGMKELEDIAKEIQEIEENIFVLTLVSKISKIFVDDKEENKPP